MRGRSAVVPFGIGARRATRCMMVAPTCRCSCIRLCSTCRWARFS